MKVHNCAICKEEIKDTNNKDIFFIGLPYGGDYAHHVCENYYNQVNVEPENYDRAGAIA